jgi:HK97 family phage portal protein
LPLIYDTFGPPIEIAAGRGDLRYHSVPSTFGAVGINLTGGRCASYAQLFADQPWVAAAVMRMQTMAVRVPLKCYRRTGDNSRVRLDPKEHPLANAIVAPWEFGSQADLIMSMLGPLLVHGNGLTEVEQGRTDSLRFLPADWRGVSPIQPFASTISGWYVDTDDGEQRTVGADTVLHLAWWSPLGPLGVSPLQQLGTTLMIEDAAQRYQRSVFNNGARPPSAITASERFLGMDPAERAVLMANLREDVNTIYSGPENGGRPALLPPGLDWKPVGHTAVEAALIEQRKVAREEVCAVYQLPPPMLGILDHATYTNIETQREMAYTDSLAPPLVLIEQKLNAHLVRGLLREDDVFVEFDFAGVLRGDRLKEVEALRAAIGTGLMTPNEGRSVLNMPKSPDDGMDVFYMPTNNMNPVGTENDDPAAVDAIASS